MTHILRESRHLAEATADTREMEELAEILSGEITGYGRHNTLGGRP